tara:strand:+ start:10 stop:972 length:963 start_codon:yes stop_codon:yes gene_type:complete
MNKKIFIVTGDPNSINSELIFKSWKKLNTQIRKKIILIGNYRLIDYQRKRLKYKINLALIKNIDEKKGNNYLKIIDFPLKFSDCFNVNKNQASKYVKGCLNLAHKICINNDIQGFINCPINKNLIKEKGIHGVTEYLAKKNLSNKYVEVMLLYNKKLSVVPLTTHIKIKEVSKKLKKELIINKVKTLIIYYSRLFNKKPRIAILGLNPHNCELEKDSEEVKIIIPAIKKLKKYCSIKGPMVADNFFKEDYKKYNIVIGMYHDQVLIPFKYLFKFDAINITLGLSYTRVSPDHGTANDIIGKDIANVKSLYECINFINRLH